MPHGRALQVGELLRSEAAARSRASFSAVRA